jgi:LysR family transcriptional regulator, transcriptional activator for bauABCD operon
MAANPFSLTERDLRALRLFRSVAEAGGLTAAERQTGLERSTVSRHIKALEERLGAAICFRGPRGFTLTEFGRDVLAAAVALDDTLDEIKRQLSRARETIRGDLCLGLADNCVTNPEARVIPALAAFGKTAPEVRLAVRIARPGELLRALREYRINCCVVGAPPGDASLTTEPLFHEDFRLFVRDDGGPAPAFGELGARGYGFVDRTEVQAPFPTALRHLGLPMVHAEGLEAVATLLATGRYVGQLPTHYAAMLRPVVPLVEVRDAAEAALRVRFSFVALASRRPSRAQERLREYVIASHAEPRAPVGALA